MSGLDREAVCGHRGTAVLVVGCTVAPYSPLAEVAVAGIMLRKKTPLPCRLERERQAQERHCYQAKEVAGLSSGDHERDEALDVVPVARAFGQHPAAIGFGHSAEEKCTEVVVLDPCREESVATGC